jgi:hypothetical protein
MGTEDQGHPGELAHSVSHSRSGGDTASESQAGTPQWQGRGRRLLWQGDGGGGVRSEPLCWPTPSQHHAHVARRIGYRGRVAHVGVMIPSKEAGGGWSGSARARVMSSQEQRVLGKIRHGVRVTPKAECAAECCTPPVGACAKCTAGLTTMATCATAHCTLLTTSQ